jgi:hypothetical protein
MSLSYPLSLFVLVLVGTRQWRAAAMAVLTFAATVAVGVVLAPGPSWWYWSGGLLRIGRVGVESALGNLSLVRVAFGEQPGLVRRGGRGARRRYPRQRTPAAALCGLRQA